MSVDFAAKKLVLILGGARSGKSDLACKLAQQASENVLFVATAAAGDDEMRRRIERHRAERPVHWRTLESPINIGQNIQDVTPVPAVVVIDCLTLLTANHLGSESTSEQDLWNALSDEIVAIEESFRAGTASYIVVSNEVGMGLVPPYPMGRVFRDVLGRVNRRVAEYSDLVLLCIAGVPITLK